MIKYFHHFKYFSRNDFSYVIIFITSVSTASRRWMVYTGVLRCQCTYYLFVFFYRRISADILFSLPQMYVAPSSLSMSLYTLFRRTSLSLLFLSQYFSLCIFQPSQIKKKVARKETPDETINFTTDRSYWLTFTLTDFFK